MVWVRPGVLLVLAILLPTSELIRLDLPTLERPTKAISGAPAGGNCRGSAAEVTKRVRTFIRPLSPHQRESARARRELPVFDINEMRPARSGPLIRVNRDY